MQHNQQTTQRLFKRKLEFPNYFVECVDVNSQDACLARINLISNCVDHVVNRLTIPHLVGNNLVKQNFFLHLADHIKSSIPELLKAKLELYIGGGVIRSLIAYLYKYIYNKKLITKLSTEEILYALLSKEEKVFNHTVVLGVGSDFDMYYQITNLDVNQTVLVENELKEQISNFVNGIEIGASLLGYTDPIKKSFLPVSDLKPYQEQINIIISQGGSHCDWLAFAVGNDTAKINKFIVPSTHPNILIDLLLKGEYEYTAAQDLNIIPEQKQTIRGCRGLLELPFTKIKNPIVLMKELQNITSCAILNEKSIEQIDKLVRNSNFGGANNRTYRSKVNKPLSRLAELSNEHHAKQEGNKYLIPHFLRGYNRANIRQSDSINQLKKYLVSPKFFIENYTDQGTLYHGTSKEGFLSIIRSGFWTSDSDIGQGNSVYGPGTYCTKSRIIAQEYSKDGFVCIIPVFINIKYPSKILNWAEIDNTFQNMLSQQAVTLGYTHVFYLLREQYNIDIIINEHIIIQNLHAVNTPKNPADLIDARILSLQQELEAAQEQHDKLTILMEQILPLCDLANAIGHVSDLNNKNLLNQYKNLLSVVDDNNLVLCLAAKYGRIEIIDCLINENNIDPSVGFVYMENENILLHVESNLALCLAVLYSKVEVVKFLLQHAKVNPAVGGRYYEGIYMDCFCCYPNQDNFYVQFRDDDIASDLYSDDSSDRMEGWFRFMAENNFLICLAAAKSSVEILELLIQDIRINPAIGGKLWSDNIDANLAVYLAAKNFNLFTLQILLTNTAVNAVLDVNKIFNYTIAALPSGLYNPYYVDLIFQPIMQIFLQHPNFNPACDGWFNNQNYCFDDEVLDYYFKVDNNWILIEVVKRGLTGTCKLLLNDARVDPSVSNNLVLYLAAAGGYIEIVQLLLQDNRIDPTAQNNYVLVAAIKQGHNEIINLLLNDSRVNPNANNHEVMRIVVNNLKTYRTNLKNDRQKINVADLRKGPSIKTLQLIIESGKISTDGIRIAKEIAPKLTELIDHWFVRTNLCNAFSDVCKQQESLVVRSLECLVSLERVNSKQGTSLFSSTDFLLQKADKILQCCKSQKEQDCLNFSFKLNYQ